MIPQNISSVLVKCQASNIENLLFQCSIHYAEQGINVWFISPQPFKELPAHIRPPDKEILKLITFLYLKDQKDLHTHLNGIHLWHKFPQLIILNGFEHYSMLFSSDYSLNNAAFTLASLLDATTTCAKRHPRGKACLLVTCVVPTDKSIHFNTLINLYFSNVLVYDENSNDSVFNELKEAFKN